MITEYVVLGVLLIVMGAVQMWLRYGSWSKGLEAEQRAVAERRAAAQEEAEEGGGEASEEESSGTTGSAKRDTAQANRGLKLWSKWTAILGPLGITLGLFLVFWGIFA